MLREDTYHLWVTESSTNSIAEIRATLGYVNLFKNHVTTNPRSSIQLGTNLSRRAKIFITFINERYGTNYFHIHHDYRSMTVSAMLQLGIEISQYIHLMLDEEISQNHIDNVIKL
jgi:hypothetical protein